MAQYVQQDAGGVATVPALRANSAEIGGLQFVAGGVLDQSVAINSSVTGPGGPNIVLYTPNIGLGQSNIASDQLQANQKLWGGNNVVCGRGTLVNGQATISSPAINGNSLIFVGRFLNNVVSPPIPPATESFVGLQNQYGESLQVLSQTVGTARIVSTYLFANLTILSDLDNSTFYWFVIQPTGT